MGYIIDNLKAVIVLKNNFIKIAPSFVLEHFDAHINNNYCSKKLNMT
jgi:hypothetical protein